MKKSKWFNKQYILLSVSILLGLIVLIVGSSYAYYIVNLNGDNSNNDVLVKTSNINLEISNVSGSLSLCKTYPISDTEGLSCTPYQFTLTNNNNTDLEYYLNLEYQISAPEDTIKVAFATCDDENCTNPNYAISKLSEILDNNDTISSKYTGKLLTSGKTFGTGASNKKTYSIILWIDRDSTYEDATFNASISAITYTQTQDILSYTLSFDLEDNATWTTDTCKSSDGYTINGTKCEKTIGVNESYGNLPSVTINGEDVLWYSDNKLFNNKATSDTKYTMRQNTIYKSTTNSALASHTFNYTGEEQIFTVPINGTYKIEAWGAQGGGANGGKGGYSSGIIQIGKGEKIKVFVGGAGNSTGVGGYNGGGNAGVLVTNNDGGGGATDIRINNININDRILVAGGGGGANANGSNTGGIGKTGGAGGGLNGYSGTSVIANMFGGGATQISGGIRGYTSRNPCTNGSFYYGGVGGTSDGTPTVSGGAGGGGGFYGGGSGEGCNNNCGGSGGGGSSYISGHTGCVAIVSDSSTSARTGTGGASCTTGTSDNLCSVHYSGKVFTDTVMIDGAGYAWTNTKGSLQQMPNPSGGYYASGVGHSGNGYARITYLH